MKQHKLADVKMTCMNSRQTHRKIIGQKGTQYFVIIMYYICQVKGEHTHIRARCMFTCLNEYTFIFIDLKEKEHE